MPGGELVYAVCSLEREEGEAQVAPFARSILPFDPAVLPDGIAPAADGTVRTDPGMLPAHGGADGFFIARLGSE